VGKGGFDYNPEAVRGFAEVFNQAKLQVDQIKGTVADTTAKAADFGKSWTEQGAEFEKYMKAVADDLANLSTHLGNIGANLMQGTDLVVNADTTAYQNIKSVDQRLEDNKNIPPGAGGH
jgi:uncharacterized protein YukE